MEGATGYRGFTDDGARAGQLKARKAHRVNIRRCAQARFNAVTLWPIRNKLFEQLKRGCNPSAPLRAPSKSAWRLTTAPDSPLMQPTPQVLPASVRVL